MAKIYISSTYSDLIDYRDAAYKSLRKMGHDVIAMEDYVACDERPLDKCLADVEKCDIYVGIFAWRYGFIPEKHTISITEQEYQHAKNNNIPCLIFMLNEKTSWSPNFMDSHTGEGEEGKLINSFRNRLKNEKVISFFDGKVDLAIEIAISVYKQEKEIFDTLKTPEWEYLLTIDLLKDGLSGIEKQYSDLQRGLIYRSHQTKLKSEILEWLGQKLDDLVALIILLNISSTEELMTAWGEPGKQGNEEHIRDASKKIISGCQGLLEWELDLAFTRLPNGFENIKKMMQGWTHEYLKIIIQLIIQLEAIVNNPNSEGQYNIKLVFKAPNNIDEIVPEVQRLLEKLPPTKHNE